MLRCNNHIGGTKERIRPGGENTETTAPGHPEIHFSSVGAADPVLLLGLYPLDIVHASKIFQQPFCVLGNLQHPLVFYLAHHFTVAAFTSAAHHFLVGQAHLAGGAPIDGGFLFICQPFFKQLQKDPLGPFIVFRVGGVNFPGPVKGKSKGLQLLLETGYVSFGYDFGMDFVLDGIVFRRQAKGVPADGKEHIVPLQAAFAGNDVKSCVRPGMAYMKPLPRGVGKLDKGVKFWL